MRRFGVTLAPSPKYQRILEKRPNPPGQHGGRRQRTKVGAYGSRLTEKQKLRAFYGIAERQMHNYFMKAARMRGPTGTNLMRLLEQRLDAVVYRLGLAPSVWSSRQIVGHGHIRVDGKKVDIPSYQVSPGQTIALSDRIKKSDQISIWRARGGIAAPAYLEISEDGTSGKLVRAPERDEIPVPVDDRLIVEFYSK
jgi:small subunit ribosomal protein S4